jgi:hypothetical protein
VLLAHKLVRDVTQRQTLALDDIGDCRWSHKFNEK